MALAFCRLIFMMEDKAVNLYREVLTIFEEIKIRKKKFRYKFISRAEIIRQIEIPGDIQGHES